MRPTNANAPEKFPSFGLAEDGPLPIYTSKTKFSALILNLENLVRGRKRSAPSAFADLIDFGRPWSNDEEHRPSLEFRASRF